MFYIIENEVETLTKKNEKNFKNLSKIHYVTRELGKVP